MLAGNKQPFRLEEVAKLLPLAISHIFGRYMLFMWHKIYESFEQTGLKISSELKDT
jgi:hypothetical protein